MWTDVMTTIDPWVVNSRLEAPVAIKLAIARK